MKRSLTGIAAAAVVLGAMSPMAFAATSKATGLTKASQLPIVVNGKVLSNPYEMTGKDSGNTTGFFPIYYFNQALAKIGFTATWDGTTHTWAITAPNVDASSISVAGGVGTGNTTVTVNGTVVKKFNTQVAKDPAGGKSAQATTYLPIYYISNVLTALGVQGSFSGQTGLSITGSAATSTGQGNISAPQVTGEKVGSGTQAAPAVSYGDPLTVTSTVTDAAGNPIAGVNATLDIQVNGQGGAPTVTANGTSVAPTTSASGDFQYAITTDANGAATAQVTVNSGTSANYTVRFYAPFNIQGTNVQVKSSKAYIEFVAPNTLGISPGTGFDAAVSTSSNSDAGLTPVTVTIPPNSETPQQGVAVTFHIANSGDANPPADATGFFATSNGGSLGTGVQTVYTDANGQATVYVDSTSEGTAYITATTSQYGTATTNISYQQAGIVSKLDNIAVTGYQQAGTLGSNSYEANIGNNVTFQATAQDQNGNPVANAQLLVVESKYANGADTMSSHGSYVNGSTTTDFPNVNVSANSVDGNTNPATLGDVVTTDASGNFNFTVTDNETNTDHYYVYAIQGGTVTGQALWTPFVQWQTGTSLNSIGIQGAGAEIKYDSQSVTGVSGQAALSYNPESLPIVRFDGFAGKSAPLSTNLNQTYNLSMSGESDASIWGVHVDNKPSTIPSGAEYIQDTQNGGYWYVLNTSPKDTPTTSYNRGVGSLSLRVVAGSATNEYDVYVNGTLIGSNIQAGWQNTSGSADGEYPGTIKLALADDDTGNATLTVSSQGKTATAAVTFTGGQAVEAESFSPSQVNLSNGQSEDLSFTLEDANGNPVANTLGAIKFAPAKNLWITKVNGNALTMNEAQSSSGYSVAPEATPIPLWDVTQDSNFTADTDVFYDNTDNQSGVNVAGVANWSPSTDPTTVYAYSDANGKISLTLQDGAASYWSTSYQTLSAPNNTLGTQSFTVYSPVDQSNYQDYSVYVAPSTDPLAKSLAWDQEGQVTWSGTGAALVTSIADKAADNNAVVTAIDNTKLTVDVASGSTASELIGAIQSTNGTNQTYSVVESDGKTAVAGSDPLVSNDELIVTAADGSTTATYTITVNS
ncbi:beta strand repeat-containing protein [Alicyclobacillus acidoterrestris]|uniref:beta strand repeat-containing protein n=1 Tax=Alicyclobacillus acidoterrestris TaxID=1450 RepID=UPI003F533CCA